MPSRTFSLTFLINPLQKATQMRNLRENLFKVTELKGARVRNQTEAM